KAAESAFFLLSSIVHPLVGGYASVPKLEKQNTVCMVSDYSTVARNRLPPFIETVRRSAIYPDRLAASFSSSRINPSSPCNTVWARTSRRLPCRRRHWLS